MHGKSSSENVHTLLIGPTHGAPCVLPSSTEPSRRLLHLFGTVCRRQYVHRRHYHFSAEDWRLNFLSGLTAVLPDGRLTVLTTMWPHIIVTCPCSPRTLCYVKSIRYHHHHHHHWKLYHAILCTVHCAVYAVKRLNVHIDCPQAECLQI